MTGLFDRMKDENSEGSEIVEERTAYEESEEEPEVVESETEYTSSMSESQETSLVFPLYNLEVCL